MSILFGEDIKKPLKQIERNRNHWQRKSAYAKKRLEQKRCSYKEICICTSRVFALKEEDVHDNMFLAIARTLNASFSFPDIPTQSPAA